MRRVLIGVTTSLAMSATALAADLPVKARPVIDDPVYNWTGFYVGGHVGGLWSRARTDEVVGTFLTPLFPAFVIVPPAVAIPTGFPTAPGTLPATDARSTSFLGGGQAGFNWQVNHLVLGIEGDVSWERIRSTAVASATRPGFEAFPVVAGQSVSAAFSFNADWAASVRGRLGYAADRWLIYATGGIAFTKVDVSVASTFTNPPPTLLPSGTFTTTLANSFSRVGWTLGAGAEWAFASSWSLAAEYRHTDFGRITLTNMVSIPQAGGFPDLAPSSTTARLTEDQVTLRLNYRFAPGPVVARF